MGIMEWMGMVAFLFAIADPIGVVPLFLGYTNGFTAQETRRVGMTAGLAVGVILCASVLCGQGILDFFHIGLEDFRVAGGMLMLIMALDMFHAQHPSELAPPNISKTELAISPLALPMMAGPGLISILITYSADAPGWEARGKLLAACISVSILVAIVLVAAVPLRRLLGQTGISVITRIMGLVVAAIGVHFITTGLRALLPGLAA